MDHSRADTIFPHLPRAGDPLLATPGGKTIRGRVLWRSSQDGTIWLAPIPASGLTAWSKAHRATPNTRSELLAKLNKPGLAASARGEVPLHQEGLPRPGDPLVLHFTLGVVYWMRSDALMACRVFNDGLLDWGSAAIVEPTSADPDEQVALDHARRALHDVLPVGRCTKLLVSGDRTRSREVTITNRWIDTALGSSAPCDDALLRLRTATEQRLHLDNAAVMDEAMELELATQISDYPGPSVAMAAIDPTHVVVDHASPDVDDGTVTIWRVDEGLEVLHDLAKAPLTLWLRAREDHPLTAARAAKLASALVAGAALLNRVQHLTVAAMRRDRPRWEAIRTEAEFVTYTRRMAGVGD